MSVFVAQRFDRTVIAVGTRAQCDAAISRLNEELMDGVRYDGKQPHPEAGTWVETEDPLYAPLRQWDGLDVGGQSVTLTEWP